MSITESPKFPRTIVLFGVPFHDVTMAETLDWIDGIVAARRPAYLVTANMDFAAQASGDVELQRILVEAELVVCDGTPLVWASHLTGKPLRERVAGSDLVPKLAARAEKMGHRLFLLGGDQDSLEKAAKNLQQTYPGLKSISCYSPPYAPLHEFDNQAIIERIQKAKPDIVLVAFGCPKQEKWIYMHYRRLGIPCCIGVGATVDFLAGKVSRAPALVSKLGLEWIYRMLQEPKRLAGRYGKDLMFLGKQLVRESRAIRAGGAVADLPELPEGPVVNGLEIVRWQGALTADRLDQLPMPTLAGAFGIDLSAVTKVDSSGLGWMLRLVRQAWKADVSGCFLAPSPAVRMVVKMTRLERILPMADTPEEGALLVAQDMAAVRLRPMASESGENLLFTMPPRITSGNSESCGQSIRLEWERRPGIKVVVLDLGETKFMDSSGLGFLLMVRRLAGQRPGGGLRLLNIQDNIRNVIQVAKLQDLLIGKQS